jgi:hypothetical protein
MEHGLKIEVCLDIYGLFVIREEDAVWSPLGWLERVMELGLDLECELKRRLQLILSPTWHKRSVCNLSFGDALSQASGDVSCVIACQAGVSYFYRAWYDFPNRREQITTTTQHVVQSY